VFKLSQSAHIRTLCFFFDVNMAKARSTSVWCTTQQKKNCFIRRNIYFF